MENYANFGVKGEIRVAFGGASGCFFGFKNMKRFACSCELQTTLCAPRWFNQSARKLHHAGGS